MALSGAKRSANRALRDARRARNALIEQQNALGTVGVEDIGGYYDTAQDAFQHQRGLADTELQQGMLGDAAMGQAGASQYSIDAQRAALEQLQGLGRGEVTEADRAAMALAQMQQGEAARGQREAVQNQYAARGMGGSQAEMAAALAGQQQGANALAIQNASLDMARQQRALQAIEGQANLTSGMRGQSFGEDSSRRAAIDAFNMNNADWTRQGMASRVNAHNNNVGWNNQWQANRAGAMHDQANNAWQQSQGQIGNEYNARMGVAQTNLDKAGVFQRASENANQTWTTAARDASSSISSSMGGM